MNSVNLIGRLTRDPELRYTQNGKAVTNFTIAVDRDFSKEKITDFFNIIAWNKQAENLVKYIGKGRLVGVTGSLQTRSYDNKDGVKIHVTEVLANSIQYLDKASGDEKQKVVDDYDFGDFAKVDDDDVPF